MKFKEILTKIKEYQKVKAQEIRELKAKRKTNPYGFVPGLENKRWEYRHRHIAYCELRGRKCEEIERTCHESPDRNRIDQLKLGWIKEVDDDKDVCACA